VKSYHHYCSVARALDAVGDRWVLLIVRELLALGPSRYSDLKRGLPGIASNLLAERLRTMEADGLVERRQAPPPVGSGIYQLTDRGRGLAGVLRELARWGVPSMESGPGDGDAVQPQWSALFAGLTRGESVGTEADLAIETGGASVRVVLHPDGFEIAREREAEPDVTMRGSAFLVGGVLAGRLTVTEATDLGLTIEGDRARLTALVADRPRPTGATQ
jgi:DNA-binding HxlR family transcriptional regulator